MPDDPPSDTPAGDVTVDDVTAGEATVMDPRYPLCAARAADDKGGTDIVVLRVGDVLAITDYFVIVSASNPRMVRTIVQEAEDQISEAGGPRPSRVEGLDECEWVLADYGSFVLHVFHTETRSYYELERLWGDVTRLEWGDPASAGVAATD